MNGVGDALCEPCSRAQEEDSVHGVFESSCGPVLIAVRWGTVDPSNAELLACEADDWSSFRVAPGAFVVHPVAAPESHREFARGKVGAAFVAWEPSLPAV